MFFIFGFGKTTTRTVGVVGKVRCSNCSNVREWDYKKVTTWFTLFFIPIIPYKVIYVKECPICNAAFIVDKNETVDHSNMFQSDHDIELTEVQKNYREQMGNYKKK